MSAQVNISEKDVFRKRRDKQISNGAATVNLYTAANSGSTESAENILAKLLAIDGTGSGLDADLLDGYHASSFLLASVYTASDVLAKLLTVDGTGSGLDADLLDGQHGNYYAPLANPTFSGTVSIPTLHVDHIVEYTGSHTVVFDSAIKGESLQSVTAFSAGFAGDGYKVIETGGISSLEVDQLTVRGFLKAYELQINKISSVNGGMIISVANAKCTTVSGTTIYFDEGLGLTIPFVVGDYIKAQQFNGTGVAVYLGHVTAVNAGNVVATTISGTPWNGMDLVQFGSSSDTTRQSAIYLTAAETNNPYIAGYAGITNGLFTGHEKFRLGNLTGISDTTLNPSGYGLYAQNAFLSGRIVLPSAGMTDEGSAAQSIRIYAGDTYANKLTAPFRVTQDGSLTAKGVAELGTSVDGSGFNVAIKGSDIWENSYNGDNSYIMINRLSYQGGQTKFRTTYIMDGKGGNVATFQGYGKIINCSTSNLQCGTGWFGGTLEVDGTTTMSGSLAVVSGSIHIGGTSDPGGNNLLVGGVAGIGGTPDACAILDCQSTTKAFILPRVSTASRNSYITPIAGMMIYNTTTHRINMYNGTAWRYFTEYGSD